MSRFYSYEEQLELPEGQRPTFNDLADHAPGNLARRGLVRYFFSRHPEATMRRMSYIGAPVVRRALVSLFRFVPRNEYNFYRIDPTRTRIEGAMKMAALGSVAFEVMHTAAGLHQCFEVARYLMHDGSLGRIAISTSAILLNGLLVGAQRYTRAEMTQRITGQLQQGWNFRPNYRNWTGIDRRAVDNYVLQSIADRPLPLEQEGMADQALPPIVGFQPPAPDAPTA